MGGAGPCGGCTLQPRGRGPLPGVRHPPHSRRGGREGRGPGGLGWVPQAGPDPGGGGGGSAGSESPAG